MLCRQLLVMTGLLLLLAVPALSATLSNKDGKRLVDETTTIAWYTELTGEDDYANKPLHVIKAAIFGAFDAKHRFAFTQEERQEAGKKLLPPNAPLLSVNGRPLRADSVLLREEAPQLFKKQRGDFTCFVSREAVELAALYFTGHSVREHPTPKGDELLGKVVLTEKGYFVSIEGLGDTFKKAELRKIAPYGEGFVLTGKIIDDMAAEDGKDRSGTFRLELFPGEEPGTWKRRYAEQGTE